MELVTYSWILASIMAPTITAICVVVLFLFNVYKGQWRNVDHFLVGLTVQEIVSSILCFALSILNLLHNRNEQLCGLITGFWFSIRTLQLVTLTSLAIDRALILKWPYQYRFSVRSLQIKSHLVFISLCCSSIALFAYSARLDQNTIQTIINDLPSSNSVSSNLAYFDLFSNPLFGSDSNQFNGDSLLNNNTLTSTSSTLDLTTPLNEMNLIKNKTNNTLIVQNNARLRSSLNNENRIQSYSSPLINIQSVYSASTAHHLSSSLSPPLTSSTESLPASTVSMNSGQTQNQHQNLFLYKQFGVCSLHPLFWQRIFNLILLGLFGILSLITIFCFIYVDCTRRSNQKRKLISQNNYLSSSNFLSNHSNNRLNKPLTGVSILDGVPHEFSNNRYQLKSNTSNQLVKSTNNLVVNSSPGNTNTTTTCASDNPTHNSHQTSSSSNNKSSLLNQATSLSTIALGDEQISDKLNNQYEQTADSMSALCSMIDHDLTRSTDALASKDHSSKDKNDKKSKMQLLSKSQPSLLHNQSKSSLDKKGSNLSVYSFDMQLNNKKQQRRPRSDANQSKNNQFKYSNQLKNRLPMRSSSMITQNNHLDDNEPFSMQSREDLFSRKYLRDHYKICDLRWSSVVTCTSLCYAVNHCPTIVSFFFRLFF